MQRTGLCSMDSFWRLLTSLYGMRFTPPKSLPSQPPDLLPACLLEAKLRPFVPADTAYPALTSKAVTVCCM